MIRVCVNKECDQRIAAISIFPDLQQERPKLDNSGATPGDPGPGLFNQERQQATKTSRPSLSQPIIALKTYWMRVTDWIGGLTFWFVGGPEESSYREWSNLLETRDACCLESACSALDCCEVICPIICYGPLS